MKKSRRKLVVLISVIMTIMAVMTGCSNGSKASGDTAGVKNVKIGVILYNYTDIQGKELKNYCDNYLAKNFPVSFEYQTATSGDNEAHLSAVDSLISTGCNAIFSGYDTVIGESMEKCESAGVYYGILFGEAKNESDQDGNYNEWGNWGTQEQSNLFHSEYFLGGLYQFGADHGYELGKVYGKAMAETDVSKVGAISFPSYAFGEGVIIGEGFAEELKAAGKELCFGGEGNTFPVEAGFVTVGDDTKNYLANYSDMDALFGLSSGMDMVLPAVNEVGRLWSNSNNGVGSIRMAALGYNESSRKYLEDGTLIIGGTNNYVQSTAYLFALAFDAVNGNNMKTDENSGYQDNGSINYVTFCTVEELDDMETYMLTTVNKNFEKCAVTAEELKSVMACYGGSASWNDLSEIVSRNIDEIKKARN